MQSSPLPRPIPAARMKYIIRELGPICTSIANQGRLGQSVDPIRPPTVTGAGLGRRRSQRTLEMTVELTTTLADKPRVRGKATRVSKEKAR